MKLFETNSAIKTISTMCAAGALLASQAVFAGSDAHSAKTDVSAYENQTTETSANNSADMNDNQEAGAINSQDSSIASQSDPTNEGYDADAQDNIDTNRGSETVGTTRMWESEDSLGFEDADSNSDSRLDRNEFSTANEQQLGANSQSQSQSQSFDDYDMNDDDYLDQNEYDSFTAGMQNESENRAASIEADE